MADFHQSGSIATLHRLGRPNLELLEQELVELGLLDYCRPALERRALQA